MGPIYVRGIQPLRITAAQTSCLNTTTGASPRHATAMVSENYRLSPLSLVELSSGTKVYSSPSCTCAPDEHKLCCL
jgi:hypothetical protein